MLGMQILRKASFVASPWKNGAGVTHEIIRVPADGAAFRWRLSVAQIDKSGPFSDFAGYDRTMVLLRGAGLRLTFDGVSTAVLRQVGDMTKFDGALKTDCQLLSGPCTDLNLMVARSLRNVSARVEHIGAQVLLPKALHGITLIFGITGGLRVENEQGPSACLGPWDLAIVQAGDAAVAPDLDQCAACLAFLVTLEDNSA